MFCFFVFSWRFYDPVVHSAPRVFLVGNFLQHANANFHHKCKRDKMRWVVVCRGNFRGCGGYLSYVWNVDRGCCLILATLAYNTLLVASFCSRLPAFRLYLMAQTQLFIILTQNCACSLKGKAINLLQTCSFQYQ